jgi:hypothetical protein
MNLAVQVWCQIRFVWFFLFFLLTIDEKANLVTTSSIFQARATKGHMSGSARGTTRSPSALAEDLASAAASSAKVVAVVDAVWMTTCEVLLRVRINFCFFLGVFANLFFLFN